MKKRRRKNMNILISNPNKVFDSGLRIQIMASLFHSSLTFSELKKICQCVDGVLSNHIKKLIDGGFVTAKRDFYKNRPRTTYTITEEGRLVFRQLVTSLNEALDDKTNSFQYEELKSL